MDIALIPQSAPFSAEQRAWLNGFLAGLLGLNHDASPAVAGPVARAAVRSVLVAAESLNVSGCRWSE